MIFKKTILIIIFIIAILSCSGGEIPFLVYYPSFLNVRKIESAIKKDPLFKSFKPKVFVKFSDFSASLKNEPISMILAPGEYYNYHSEYEPKIHLLIDGKKNYYLQVVSLNGSSHRQIIEGAKVGLVQTIEKTYLSDSLDKLFGGVAVVIRRVSRTGDLFPLLALKNVDYVLLSQNDLNKSSEFYHIEINKVKKVGPLPTPVLGFHKDLKIDDVLLKNIKDSTLENLGFSGLAYVGELGE